MHLRDLKSAIRQKAKEMDFDVCRITPARLPTNVGDALDHSIKNNWHASMEWLASTRERRRSPEAMWSEARTAIMLGMNYGPGLDPLALLEKRGKATISVYARHRDYHDLIKGKLKQVAGWLVAKSHCDVKVFVDTAPLMEKPLAQQAGVGWQGKHSNLVSRDHGSWLFLGAILTDLYIEPDEPETDHCGTCRKCLDICPTDAFPAPYKLDARKCISYLTIEHNGPVPVSMREKMGNRIFGCDDCLAVCPWNKYAQETSHIKLAARKDLLEPDLEELAGLDDTRFRKKFSGSPVKRIGRNRFLRNVLIAIGNSGQTRLAQHTKQHLDDASPLVRGASVWALSRLVDREELTILHNQHSGQETDQVVLEEWEQAIAG